MTNDEILQRMTELLKQYTTVVERDYVPGQPSRYHWVNFDAENEFIDLVEVLRLSFSNSSFIDSADWKLLTPPE